jgi:hypothetical protein
MGQAHQRWRFTVTTEHDAVVIAYWRGPEYGRIEYDALALTPDEARALRDALTAALEHPGAVVTNPGD